MKAGPECPECLRRLALATIELSTEDSRLKAELVKDVDRILGRFSLDEVPTLVSKEFLLLIKERSGNPDAYLEKKRQEIETCRQAFSKLRPGGDFRSCVELAAKGNAMDFFVGQEDLVRSLAGEVRFAVDDVELLERRSSGARILYLGDNAGEAIFDVPLVKALGERAEVVYGVKSSPVQNDVTVDDLRLAGLEGSFGRIVKGPPTVGVDLGMASPEFLEEFENADIVVAKGMGNYETLSELPQVGRFFYIFRAKCAPVARSLGLKVGDYVAMLQ